MVTAPTLIQQLHGKVDELRRMSDQLRQGDILRPVITQANDQSVWVRGPQIAFSGWIQAFDAWVRNQFVGALDAVRLKIEAYVRDFDNAQQAFANGIPGVALPPPPSPVGMTPPNCPYPFQMQVPKGTNPNMNPDLMRRGLANAIGRAKEELHGFSIRLNDILTEPAPVPGAPVVPGAPPMRHLPPDAKEAAGIPRAYEAIGMELEKALRDVLERADAWEKVVEDEMPTSSSSDLAGAVAGIGVSAGAAVAGSQDAVTDVTALPTTLEAQAPDQLPQTEPEKPPPTPEQVEEARREGAGLADEALKNDVLNKPDELLKTAKAIAAQKDNPAAEAFAAAFVEKFGAANMVTVSRKLHSWQTGTNEALKPKPGAFLQFEEPPPRPKNEDVQGILYAFSATLATATQYDDFDTEIEEDILTNEDQLALSWLLANPDADFDADFLVKAFDLGVKNTLLKEANLTGIGIYERNEVPLQLAGGKLESDPKLAVLDAISRNPAAAMRIADMEFKPPLTVAMGMRPAVRVNNVVELLYNGGNTNSGYADKGAALGRFLDAAHAGFCKGGDTVNANELVDRILGGATSEKEVAKARAYLRDIGARHPVTVEESQKALDRVRQDPKHPGRELLLAQAAQSRDAAVSFVNSQADKSKEKILFDSQAGWDLVALALKSQDTSTEARKAAEDTLEWAIKKIGEGKDLSPEARRGLALALPLRMDHISDAVIDEDKGKDPSEKGINFAAEDVIDTLKEIARDDEALGIAVSGLGGWASNTYAGLAAEFDKAVKNPQDMLHIADVADSVGALHLGALEQIGTMFCTMTNSVHLEGKDREARAKRILGFYQFGVNLAFDVVPGLKNLGDIAIKGHKVPGSAADPITDGLKEGLAAGLSGIDTGAIAAKAEQRTDSTEETLEHMVRENMMTALAKRPGFLERTGIPLPDFMFNEPLPIKNPDGAYSGGYPESYLKNEYLDAQGSVRLPGPGDETYSEFQDWCTGSGTQNESLLYNFAGATTEKVYNKMKLCLDKAMR